MNKKSDWESVGKWCGVIEVLTPAQYKMHVALLKLLPNAVPAGSVHVRRKRNGKVKYVLAPDFKTHPKVGVQYVGHEEFKESFLGSKEFLEIVDGTVVNGWLVKYDRTGDT